MAAWLTVTRATITSSLSMFEGSRNGYLVMQAKKFD
jgi:hypothetical protein